MLEIARKYPVYIDNLEKFIKEFPTFCPYCYHRAPLVRGRQFTDPIWKILASKFKINIENSSRKE